MLNNYLLTVSQQASLFLTMNAGMSFMSVLDSGYRHGVEYMRGRDAQTVRERQTVSPHAPLHPSLPGFPRSIRSRARPPGPKPKYPSTHNTARMRMSMSGQTKSTHLFNLLM